MSLLTKQISKMEIKGKKGDKLTTSAMPSGRKILDYKAKILKKIKQK